MPGYIIRTIKEGCCPVLLPCTAVNTGKGETTIYPDTAGFVSLKEILEKKGGCILSGYKDLLSAMRCIISAALTCSQWFIPDRFISLIPEDLYFGQNGQTAIVMLKPFDEDFEARMLALVRELGRVYPETNGCLLLERLTAAGPGLLNDKKSLYKALCLWEEEIRR